MVDTDVRMHMGVCHTLDAMYALQVQTLAWYVIQLMVLLLCEFSSDDFDYSKFKYWWFLSTAMAIAKEIREYAHVQTKIRLGIRQITLTPASPLSRHRRASKH